MSGSVPNLRRFAAAAALAAGALALSGCMSSPTYGTGKPANQQLLEDITGMVSLAPKRGPAIDYKPRPGIVKPADKSTLPAPQDNILTASAQTGQWPESPEQRRARLRQEATENRNNIGFRPQIRSGVERDPDAPMITSTARWDRGNFEVTDSSAQAQREYRKAKTIARQGSPSQRRYLSEPPLDYRVPADSAPVGELGEDEEKKERRLKAESRRKAGRTSWRDFVPWL